MPKRIYLCIVVLLFGMMCRAQQIRTMQQNYFNQTTQKNISPIKIPHSNNEDSMRMRAVEESDKNDSILNRLNTIPGIVFSGLGGVTNVENASLTGGNFSVGGTFRLQEYHFLKSSQRWLTTSSVYINFNTRSNASIDSANVAKSFLFPEISKRDFIFGYTRDYSHLATENKIDWGVDPTFEFSLNNYNNDSISQHFFSESFLIGANFSKMWTAKNIGTDPTLAVGFQLFPYFNYINVQKKFLPQYHSILGEDHLSNNISSVGMQAILRIAQMAFSVNMKYVLNKSNNIQNADLHGLNYTVGIALNTDLMNFNTQ